MPKKKNGPGKSYRQGITVPEFFKIFPDDKAAEQWFETVRWGEAGKPTGCPHCGSTEKQSVKPSCKPLPYWCGTCRSHYNVKTETVMHRSKISYQNWAYAIYLWSTNLKGVSSMELYRSVGISQKSAHFMAHRIREAWITEIAQMNGEVEVDETFIGGKRHTMSNQKRKELEGTGRGGVGKSIIVGIKNRDTNQIAVQVIKTADKETLHGFIHDHVKKGSVVYTDEALAYKGLDGYEHEAVNHSVKEFVKGQAHTNGIESFWSLLKRGYQGTFHTMSAKHLHRYANEFATRHNLRNCDTIEIMEKTVKLMEGKRLTHRDLVDGKQQEFKNAA